MLALERISADHEDPFLREGMQMVVDGNDPEMVRHILELDINAAEQKHEGYAKFSSPPGICSYHGDHRYRHGLDPRVGQSARPNGSRTFDRGRFYRHFIRRRECQYYLLPIATKIKARSEEEIANMELLEGIMAVQNGEHPLLVRKS